jgi:hypothetical protein
VKRLSNTSLDERGMINVRFGPLCGLKSDVSLRPRSANSRPEQVQQTEQAYSITSSAVVSNVGGNTKIGQ